MAEQRTDEARLANAMRQYTDDGPPAPRPVWPGRPRRAVTGPAVGAGSGRAVPRRPRARTGTPAPGIARASWRSDVAIVGGGAAPAPPPLIPADRGAFTPTGRMSESREKPTLTLLQDGRVLVVAGYPTKTSAELFDPVSGEFTPAGDMATARWGQTATLLEDGRVLVTGGTQTGPLPPRCGTPGRCPSRPSGRLPFERFMGTVGTPPGWRVLISGGQHRWPDEVWDPSTGEFTSAEPHPRSPTTRKGRPSATAASWSSMAGSADDLGPDHRNDESCRHAPRCPRRLRHDRHAPRGRSRPRGGRRSPVRVRPGPTPPWPRSRDPSSPHLHGHRTAHARNGPDIPRCCWPMGACSSPAATTTWAS